MITIRSKGDLSKTKNFLTHALKANYLAILNSYGEKGVQALSANTPYDTGKTASSWYYTIANSPNSISITWRNSNVNKGVPIAIILHYGHGTRNGGYVQGIDYINPALEPIFDQLADELFEEVTRK